MGAISLYRGNLHRVPDVPRRWLMPSRQISLKDFKALLHRRSRALTRRRTTTTTFSSLTTAIRTNPTPHAKGIREPDTADDVTKSEPLIPQEANGVCGDVEEVHGELGGTDCSSPKPIGHESVPATDSNPVPVDTAADTTGGQSNSKALQEENPDASGNPNPETKQTSNIVDASLDDKEKRKREVEEKLQVLNEKKHNLVQVLKQILNAEEELKRRSSMQLQGLAGRPPVPLQVDVGNDSGSMNRQVSTRMVSEGNLGGGMDGGEADDNSNHNMLSRHLLRMSSLSPSSGSPHRKPAFLQHNTVPYPSRANLGVTSSPSPSRFAPMGHQVHPSSAPTVSVSGTSYIASSPSPAASGGTSVFREARLPSPWN